ncbi:hypothetical protein LCGC14_2624140 [marine sediment metagenome]|uniref:Uncharacterized protein n=1 Tax=marine sediment metagenome TaxID=412755 RepID=A0A0F9CD72_9ZZZZ
MSNNTDACPDNERCKVCDRPTSTVFNIVLKAVRVCPSCSLAIAKQEVASWGVAQQQDAPVQTKPEQK